MQLILNKNININSKIVKPVESSNCDDCELYPCDDVRKLYDIKYCFIGNRPIKFLKGDNNE